MLDDDGTEAESKPDRNLDAVRKIGLGAMASLRTQQILGRLTQLNAALSRSAIVDCNTQLNSLKV